MSKAWPSDAFQAATDAPRHFVPQGFPVAERLDEGGLAARMRGAKTPFQARDVRSWLNGSGFTPKGFAPAASSDPAPTPVEVEPSIAELVPEPLPAPVVDTQAVFDAGVAEGQRRAAIAAAADADACARLMSSLAQGQQLDRPALAQRLRQTVLLLVTQLVGEVGISPERLGSRVDDAIRLLADVTEPARLSLHPDDLAMMKDRLAPNIAAVADPAIERGGFRLETLSATIEDGPTLWLEQLAGALDRVAAPGE